MAMQVPTEEEILAGAIAGTEQEIFDDANDRTEDENNGDRSLEEMDDDIPGESEEGDDEPDEEEPDGETDETEEEIDAASEEDGEEPEPTQSEDRGRIPSSRLREETERRRAIESKLLMPALRLQPSKSLSNSASNLSRNNPQSRTSGLIRRPGRPINARRLRRNSPPVTSMPLSPRPTKPTAKSL